MISHNRIIIVGGGIGGLAAAIALGRNGFRTIVLEKSSKLAEVGAGIQLGPNTFHALDCLGIGETAPYTSITCD